MLHRIAARSILLKVEPPPVTAARSSTERTQHTQPVSDAKLNTLLRRRFGLDGFRPGQKETIRALLAGRDALAVLPTGAGKSLVYQLTAHLLPGVTVVVSPLLALMKDQIDSLEEMGVAVSVVNSAQSGAESTEDLRKVLARQSKLLYVTPERFDNEEFLDAARAMEVSLLVVDEAHCISEWGHSFRPAYLTLSRAVAQLRRPTILALTATATPWVRRDVIERLGMRDPTIVVRGSDRPNLFLEVRRVEEEHQDRRELELLLTGDCGTSRYVSDPDLATGIAEVMQGSGIVYTATTKAAKETAEWLREWGISADYYHGQRRKADRERVQDGFMSGEVRVIAATNAFGLGVDKPDVRFVIHRDIPASLEAYYQEAGRAGRDGALARCTLIYRPADLSRTAFLASTGHLTREEVAAALPGIVALRSGTTRQMEAASGLTRADFTRLVVALKECGALKERRRRLEVVVNEIDPEAVPLEAEERRLAYERSRQEMMRGYADLDDCRRRYVLNYFGEDYANDRCRHCDVDLLEAARASCQESSQESSQESDLDTPSKGSKTVEPGMPNVPVQLHERVEHATHGPGTIQRVEEDSITVLFDDAGYKKLAIGVLERPDLLKKIA